MIDQEMGFLIRALSMLMDIGNLKGRKGSGMKSADKAACVV